MMMEQWLANPVTNRDTIDLGAVYVRNFLVREPFLADIG